MSNIAQRINVIRPMTLHEPTSFALEAKGVYAPSAREGRLTAAESQIDHGRATRALSCLLRPDSRSMRGSPNHQRSVVSLNWRDGSGRILRW